MGDLVCGLTITKRFSYRGDPNEEWSNKYWLTGTPPTTDATWRVLFDQLVAIEKTCYRNTTHVVSGYGYNDNAADANAVWSVDLTILTAEVPGTLVDAAGAPFAGDQAGLMQWLTARRSTRGKPIWLRKYFHDGFQQTADPDRISTPTVTAYSNFGAALNDGSWAGSRRLRSQFHDETLLGLQASPFITTRTLKRRGKRP